MAGSTAMAQDFKHIKVTPADDEVVILAGVSPGATKSRGQASAPNAKHAQEARTGKDAYQPTTLEDIESSKMPKMQIAVIVVAVIVLIAFGIWFALS